MLVGRTQLCFYLKATCFGMYIDDHRAKNKIIQGVHKTQCTKHRHVFVASHTFYNINIIFPLLQLDYYRPCITLRFYYRKNVF